MPYHPIADVIRRWVAIAEGETDLKQLDNWRVPVIHGKIYAYGANFELARARRNAKGKVTHYIINGDLLQSTGWNNASHQSTIRSALRQYKQVIIPFSALEEAGVDLDTVQIIDVLADRNETIPHHSHTFPEKAVWHRDAVYGERQLDTDEAKAEWLRAHHWQTEIPERVTSWTVQVGTRPVLRTGRAYWHNEITVTANDDGTTSYDWETHHHWLGESLIRARVTWRTRKDGGPGESLFNSVDHHRWAYFLSGFDHQEPTPLYFLAELPPKVKPTTVAEAYESLKPEPVLLAEQMERKVTRQGDIFAVETALKTRTLTTQGAVYERRALSWEMTDRKAELLGTSHRATEVARMPDGITLARGFLYHDPMFRDADHIRRRIGDGKAWHIIVKNTVPNARPALPATAAGS